MIKRIKRKFILMSMLSVIIVITGVCLVLNYINFKKIDEQTDTVLHALSNNKYIVTNLVNKDDVSSEVIQRSWLEDENKDYAGMIFVKMDKNNNLVKLYSENYSEDNFTKYDVLNRALYSNKEKGFINSYKFLKVEYTNYKVIYFINAQRELGIFYIFLANSIGLALLVVSLVFVLLLILSKKILSPMEESYRKQKQFITDASHELKTPLAIIRSNTEVLELEVGETKWLTNIQNQVDRLTSLVNSLVSFSRIEEREKIEKNRFVLSNLVKERVEEFSELATFKSKELVANIEKNIFFYGDKQEITQLIDLLLDNAIKYATKDSKIKINLNKNKKYVNFSIKNSASGIKKGDLSKVFERFYRLDESRSTDVKGYGIGLSLAKLICDKHNIKVKAHAPKDEIFEIDMKFLISTERIKKII